MPVGTQIAWLSSNSNGWPLDSRRTERVMADVWLGLALTCSYTLVAMAVVFAFLVLAAALIYLFGGN